MLTKNSRKGTWEETEMPSPDSSRTRTTYTVSPSGRSTEKANEHHVRVLRDGEPVRQVVVVSTSSSSAYFRNETAEGAKRKK